MQFDSLMILDNITDNIAEPCVDPLYYSTILITMTCMCELL